ncbi:hypothetical protein [Parasphingopyxis sp.]|uniref:hypothetical protein n=1 Tax=Parasphingopyxis sp. TaxID=1920299 RepID=UPI0026151644|nr:hypothetical protein [Parasphingopyxis sp.]
MADNNKSDPMDAMRTAMSDLEARFDEMSKAVFGTDAFARTTGAATELGAKVQKGVSDQMSKNLEFFNMPSRTDITAIGERLMTMDERLVRIEEALAKLVPDEPAAASGPPRTRKPPAKKAAKKKSD